MSLVKNFNKLRKSIDKAVKKQEVRKHERLSKDIAFERKELELAKIRSKKHKLTKDIPKKKRFLDRFDENNPIWGK